VYRYEPGKQQIKDEYTPIVRAVEENSPGVVKKKEGVA